MKHFVTILLLTSFVNCVPVQQQVIDSRNHELKHYETLEIQVSEEEFFNVLNPEIKNTEQVNIDDNFQSGYTLQKYGEMFAGKTVKQNYHHKDVFKILGNYLVFSIQTGGYGASPLIREEIIWNGKYYYTDDGPTVDLVFSFKNLDHHRALVHKNFKVDLTPIMNPISDNININFMGYDRLINFRYNTDSKP